MKELELDNSKCYDLLVSRNGMSIEFRVRGWKVLQTLCFFALIDNSATFLDGTQVFLDKQNGKIMVKGE